MSQSVHRGNPQKTVGAQQTQQSGSPQTVAVGSTSQSSHQEATTQQQNPPQTTSADAQAVATSNTSRPKPSTQPLVRVSLVNAARGAVTHRHTNADLPAPTVRDGVAPRSSDAAPPLTSTHLKALPPTSVPLQNQSRPTQTATPQSGALNGPRNASQSMSNVPVLQGPHKLLPQMPPPTLLSQPAAVSHQYSHDHPCPQQDPPRARPQLHFQGVTPQLHALITRLQPLAGLNDFEARHHQHLVPGWDTGRILLLRHAIEKGDWVFLLLAQLHCLSGQPHQLPKSIRNVDPACWAHVEDVLGPNERLSHGFFVFCLQFPIPSGDMLDSLSSSVLFSAMSDIEVLLKHLCSNWARLKHFCQIYKTPPLVQTLNAHLAVDSITTMLMMFTSICRSIYPQALPDIVLEQMRTLHQLDQVGWREHGRRWRLEGEAVAYEAFRSTYRVAMSIVLSDKFNQGGPTPRLIPANALGLFRIPQGPASAEAQGSASIPPRPNPIMTANLGTVSMSHPRSTGHSSPLNAMQFPPVANLLSANFPALPRRVSENAQIQHSVGASLVLPRDDEVPRGQPVNPNTARMALHQAHLRSPIPRAAGSPVRPSNLYRFVKGWALTPKILSKGDASVEYTFTMSDQDVASIPKLQDPERPGALPFRPLEESSRTYRLRCCAMRSGAYKTESEWVVAENVWPNALCLEFNWHVLEPRLKLHHGRDLPIDLTSFVQLHKNSLHAFIIAASAQPFDYALAVEEVHVISHENILATVAHLESAQSLAAIKDSLAGAALTDDDEITVTSSSLTIKLFDPYANNQMCTIPVRGKTCLHKDPFDLETFLSLCRRVDSSYPTVVDCWRCPICRGDVRPAEMLVDDFLVDVRKDLEARGLLNTRAIVVEADGTWTPKKDYTNTRDSTHVSEDRPLGVRSQGSRDHSGSAPPKPIEVIELD